MRQLAVGIHSVDSEHERLVENVGGLLATMGDMPRERLVANLETFETLVLEHFATEEMLMSTHKYPKLDEHRSRHEGFLKGFLLLKEQIAAAPRPLNDFKPLLENQLAGWLHAHITSCDVPMGVFLRSAGVR